MNKAIILGMVLLGLFCGVISHSYVTNPITRGNQRETNAGCRGAGCLGPCEVPLARKSREAIATSRGSKITIQWPRNNHAGGFIRFAWAPTSQSDSHASFDSNVHQINCHEVGGCGPDDASNPNGGDSGPGDGSSRACTTVLTVPPHLSDGEWTLQWAWFGGAFALGDYYSCVDYKISGGASGSYTPVFVGGDFSYPGQQKCKFFSTNKLHQCINEPCNTPLFNGEQSGAPAYIQLGVQTPTVPTPTVPAPTVPAPTVPTPTVPAPTVPAPTVPSPTPTPTTPAPTGSCTPGHMKCMTETTFRTCRLEKQWDVTQSCGANTVCVPNGNYIYCGAANPTTPAPTIPPTPTVPAPTVPAPTVPAPTVPVPTVPTSSQTCKLGTNRCVGDTKYQSCGRNEKWAAVQSCSSGLVCQVEPKSGLAYCVGPNHHFRSVTNESDASKLLSNSIWISLVLFSVYLLI